ncbi:MAG TPA: GNAT family N-acetyltransferase [Gaiellaceae bacterium]|nr:GNAT family N-acetyltransferase [Gaiellaceae bacterium]
MPELEAGGRLEAADYRRLRAAVGWSTPPADDTALQAALDRTWNVVAREQGEIVGIGRLLDDGALYATIWDMIVVPGAQRRGIGTAIVERLLERAAGRTIVALVATPEGRPLYERFGFRPGSDGSVAMLLRPPGLSS